MVHKLEVRSVVGSNRGAAAVKDASASAFFDALGSGVAEFLALISPSETQLIVLTWPDCVTRSPKNCSQTLRSWVAKMPSTAVVVNLWKTKEVS